MNIRVVTTQEEFNKLPNWFVKPTTIEIWATERITVSRKIKNGRIEVRGHSQVLAVGTSAVVAREYSYVLAWNESSIEARDYSHIRACDNSHIEALDYSTVVAKDNSRIIEKGDNVRIIKEGNNIRVERPNQDYQKLKEYFNEFTDKLLDEVIRKLGEINVHTRRLT